jgi:hypothetical protein
MPCTIRTVGRLSYRELHQAVLRIAPLATDGHISPEEFHIYLSTTPRTTGQLLKVVCAYISTTAHTQSKHCQAEVSIPLVYSLLPLT